MTATPSEMLETWFEHARTGEEDLGWAAEELDELVREEPALAWPVIRDLVRAAPDERSLYAVAAGPLEALLRTHGPAVVDALRADAVSDDRLRRALGGVWRGEGIAPDVWAVVQALAIPEGALGAHAFSVEAPPGWERDDAEGLANAVWVPADADDAEGAPALIVRAGWKSPDDEPLAAFVRRDVAARSDPGVEVAEGAALPAGTGALAPVRRFRRAGGGAAAIAYVDAPRAVFWIALAAESEAAVDAGWPALAAIVASFRLR